MATSYAPSERSENPPQPGHERLGAKIRGFCPSCAGWGDHGLDDEGKPFTCFTCYGAGWVAAERFEESDE